MALEPESQAAGNIQQCQQLLDLFARLKCHSDNMVKMYWYLISEWVDRVLMQIMKAGKLAKKEPGKYAKANAKHLSLVMIEATLLKVCDHEGPFSGIEAELIQFVNSSSVGAKLSDKSASVVMSEQATQLINKKIEVLKTNEVIDAAALMAAEQDAYKEIMALPGADFLP